MRRLIAALGILLAGMLPSASNGASGLSQRIYWYPSEGVQKNIPCGGVAPAAASAVYVEITENLVGVSTQQLVNGVRLNGVLLWQQEGDVVLRVSAGKNLLARYYQRMSPGTWTFEASTSVADSECVVTR